MLHDRGEIEFDDGEIIKEEKLSRPTRGCRKLFDAACGTDEPTKGTRVCIKRTRLPSVCSRYCVSRTIRYVSGVLFSCNPALIIGRPLTCAHNLIGNKITAESAIGFLIKDHLQLELVEDFANYQQVNYVPLFVSR